MRLTYLYNSGFALEHNDATLVFDYYRDSSDSPEEGTLHRQILNNKGSVYVFCSHSHPDHFNREILSWRKDRPDITYIFSKELLDAGKCKPGDAVFLDKLETYKDECLEVKAYGSTDIGGSFHIRLQGKSVFHAGDLNNWHWNEESTTEEIAEAENQYLHELGLLAKDVSRLDLAMFPVDRRLGKDYMRGAEQFVEAIQVDILAPMHFREDYNSLLPFESYARQHNCESICWKHRGQAVTI